MSLINLPTEILLCILENLSPDFFYHDIRRLAVSKRWYVLVWPLFARQLNLTSASLPLFLRDKKRIVRRVQSHVTSARLWIDDRTTSYPEMGSREFLKNERWTEEDGRMRDAAAILRRHFPTLRSLSLTFRDFTKRMLMRGYRLTFRGFLGLPHLTSLEIDIKFPQYVGEQMREEGCCLCGRINPLLRTLRRLWCRLDPVCDLLLLLDDEQAAGVGGRSGGKASDSSIGVLEELIINLDFKFEGPIRSNGLFPDSCRGSPSILPDGTPIREHIKRQAAAISLRMSEPKMVRVIVWEPAAREVHALDFVTQRRSRLPVGYEWDAEGEVIPEDGRGESDYEWNSEQESLEDEELWISD
jgi:hypothetical protein